MKKLITLLILLISISIPFCIRANVDVTLDVDNDVEGTVNTDLVNQSVTLTLSDFEYSFNVSVGDTITDWFTNIPSGLVAKVTSYNYDQITVGFSGQTDTEAERIIQVVVPSGKLLDGFDNPIEGTLSNDFDTEDSKYIIQDLSIRAYYNAPVTISGCVGEELIEQYVYIKLVNDTYKASFIGSVLSTYNGLTATVMEVDSDNIAKVRYNGTPEAEDHSLIHSTVKKDYLNLSDQDLTVPDREDVLFDIGSCQIIPEPTVPDEEPEIIYSIPTTGIE